MKIKHNTSYTYFFIVIFFTLSLISCTESEKSIKNYKEVDKLIEYVKDSSDFNYKIIDTIKFKGASLYRIKMNSGKWLTEEIVDEVDWWHWVDIVIPDTIKTSASLLFIGGGSKFDDKIFLDSLSVSKAIKTKSVITHVSNIPFQPLVFHSSDSIKRYEDDLIAYGWDKFLKGGAKKEDHEWLARFPMTRAVVRAMDVIQEHTSTQSIPVENFFVTGASKRGWTTWTTAAVDKRVIGIAPLVIDLLNVVPSFEHHYRIYGDWSPAVQDYVDFEIMDWMKTEEFKTLTKYVEPYQFRHLFTMPKLIINGTIDEFFATDSWKFYWNDLPEKKYLQYVPNGNHGLLGRYSAENIFSFYERLIYSDELPNMDWKIYDDIFHINVGNNVPHQISLWQINNPVNRDFRIWEVGRNWKKTKIKSNKLGEYKLKAPSSNGFTASLIEVVFYQNSSTPITLTSGTYVLPDKYPFEPYKQEVNSKN